MDYENDVTVHDGVPLAPLGNTTVEIFRTKSESKCLAYINVKNDLFSLSTLKLMQGPNGLYIIPPNKSSYIDKEGKTTYNNIFEFLSPALIKSIRDTVVEEFNKLNVVEKTR